MQKVIINGKELSEDKVYFIAEIGLNHDGSITKASEMIKQAKLSGADAVKFQSYTTDNLWNRDWLADMIGRKDANKTISVFKKCELSTDDFISLKSVADR